MIKKSSKLILIILFLVQFMVNNAYAQQQTRQVAPSTGNPQGSSVELFSHQQRSQTANPQQMSDENIVIAIPKGRPSAAPHKNNTTSNNILIISALICLILASIITAKYLLDIPQIDEINEYEPTPAAENKQNTDSSSPKSPIKLKPKTHRPKKKRKKRR